MFVLSITAIPFSVTFQCGIIPLHSTVMIFFISFWMIFEALGHIGRFNTIMIKISNISALEKSLATILVTTKFRNFVFAIEAIVFTITNLGFESADNKFAWAKYKLGIANVLDTYLNLRSDYVVLKNRYRRITYMTYCMYANDMVNNYAVYFIY